MRTKVSLCAAQRQKRVKEVGREWKRKEKETEGQVRAEGRCAAGRPQPSFS